MIPKTFDCVEMKRKAALRIFEETKGLSFEGKVDYWRKKNEASLRRNQAKHSMVREEHSKPYTTGTR